MLVAVPKKDQFNISLSAQLKKRLEDLAVEFEMERGTKVGAEIIETFVEHWAKLRERIRETKRQVESEIMASVERPPLVKGAARDSKTSAAGRKNTR